MSANAVDGENVSARFRIRLPGSARIETVSTSFLNATFRLLAGVPTDRGAMYLGEVRADRRCNGPGWRSGWKPTGRDRPGRPERPKVYNRTREHLRACPLIHWTPTA